MTESTARITYDEYVETHSDVIDDLDAELAARHPDLPGLIAAAVERRALMKRLSEARRHARVSQAVVARRMGTSQAFVSRLERGLVDPAHSTEDRYAAAIGMKVVRKLVRA